MTPTRSNLPRLVLVATASGALATLAAAQSPLLAAIPPLPTPWVPLDLRWFALPLAFALTQTARPLLPWPLDATAVTGLAVLAAVLTHAHQSALLAFIGTPWARPGTHVQLLPMLASLASILAGVFITLETAGARLAAILERRGLNPRDQQRGLMESRHVTAHTLTLAALGSATLLILLRLGGRGLAGTRLPYGEIAAIALVLLLGAAYLGLQRSLTRDDDA